MKYFFSKPYLFSALLKREYLREEENLIVKKYSRYSEKDFVIFGTVTQSKDGQPDLPAEEPPSSGDMKEAVAQMILKLSEVEKQFTGKLKNEIMVDPIAIDLIGNNGVSQTRRGGTPYPLSLLGNS